MKQSPNQKKHPASTLFEAGPQIAQRQCSQSLAPEVELLISKEKS